MEFGLGDRQNADHRAVPGPSLLPVDVVWLRP